MAQLRDFFQLVARPHIISPHMLDGEAVAVPGATEMHVFLLQAITALSLTYREVRPTQTLLQFPSGRSAFSHKCCFCFMDEQDPLHVLLMTLDLVAERRLFQRHTDDLFDAFLCISWLMSSVPWTSFHKMVVVLVVRQRLLNPTPWILLLLTPAIHWKS